MKKSNMQIGIIGGRQSHGKSMAMLVMAQHPKAVIICSSEQRADRLQEMAKELALKPINTKVINNEKNI